MGNSLSGSMDPISAQVHPVDLFVLCFFGGHPGRQPVGALAKISARNTLRPSRSPLQPGYQLLCLHSPLLELSALLGDVAIRLVSDRVCRRLIVGGEYMAQRSGIDHQCTSRALRPNVPPSEWQSR